MAGDSIHLAKLFQILLKEGNPVGIDDHFYTTAGQRWLK